MGNIANRRSVMTLFSSPSCHQCHRTRMVLAEKGITYEVTNVENNELPEDLVELNPYNSVPTLIDRELVLYEARVINEYLDERFPHPPLMPVDPVSRAKSKIALYRMDRDWYGLVEKIEHGSESEADQARRALGETLTANAELFAFKPFYLSDEISLLDCAIAPLLWRLPLYGIELPPQAKAVIKYANKIFELPSFQTSLSDAEREMRPEF